ncbi:hypothetical protein, partial [Robertmurraya massiliosenegalensis]|uniref:hypothetical protein n=1 Tax=Robertmurraya massiliosenegalensis TaxID=1287657 RepID=UPI000A02D185
MALFEGIAGISPVILALFHDACSLSGIFPVIFSCRYSYRLFEHEIEGIYNFLLTRTKSLTRLNYDPGVDYSLGSFLA